MKYSCVLFDMDGTVLNTIDDLRNAVNHSLRTFGFPEISTADACRFLGNGARHLIECAVPSGTPSELTERVLADYIPYYQAHCCEETAPYSGITELIHSLRSQGTLVGIVSNKPDPAVHELSELFFRNMLDISIGESPSIRRKPAPDTVLAALESLHVSDHSSCVYIGDTEVDIETARNAGLDCIAVSWGFRTKADLIAAGASCIVNSVEELSALLLT